MKAIVPAGRLDSLAEACFEAGLRLHGNPALRIAAKMAKPHISQALTEAIGPGTAAGKWANDLLQAAGEFEKRFLEARKQIEAEDFR